MVPFGGRLKNSHRGTSRCRKAGAIHTINGAQWLIVLAYMDFPREHWAQTASTNPLERVNREIKRRADVIGIFSNDDAIIRLVGAFAIVLEPMAHNGSLLETNDEWTVARRYMSLETLARVTDNPTVRLPAVAT
jgi:putative transposase